MTIGKVDRERERGSVFDTEGVREIGKEAVSLFYVERNWFFDGG